MKWGFICVLKLKTNYLGELLNRKNSVQIVKNYNQKQSVKSVSI